MDIDSLLSSSEGKTLEFKRDLSSPKPILKTLLAFTNTEGVSSVRNIVISRVLHELGLMEQWGSGYQRIVNVCRQEGYPEPEWQELGSCVRVIFRPHPDVPANVGVNDAEWNERQLWFVQQLMAGVDVKSEDLKEHWGITIRTAERDIAEIRRKEVIEFIGAAKTGRYQLKSKK